MNIIDETHDAERQSWVASANEAGVDFPLQNLPFGVFKAPDGRVGAGIAIGDQVVDLSLAFKLGFLDTARDLAQYCSGPTLNLLFSLGRDALASLRKAAFNFLAKESPHADVGEGALLDAARLEMLLPAQIGDFSDFYTSVHHASRGSQLARPGTPLLFPNFQHLPVAYHGRASSVVPSEVPCIRPNGQTALSIKGDLAGATDAFYVPTDKLDFELEVGFFVGRGNELGKTISLDASEDSIAGVCLVNDWSARDVQRWESAPLGPFLAKSFMTTISPWVVTLDALAPFRVPVKPRGTDEPRLSKYLKSERHDSLGALDISLSVEVVTRLMRQAGGSATRITQAHFAEQYWSIFQMLTHHASNGCNLRTGDLLSSGTVSDKERENAGCLFELTLDGKEPLRLPNGEVRTYLEDGDEVTLSGTCSREGFRSIGFGRCSATVRAAVALN